jgi:transitional endoplasmic reticulum ATPase
MMWTCKDWPKTLRGYVGSDIEAVSREAVMLALRDNLQADKITMKTSETHEADQNRRKSELIQYH